MKRSEMIQKVVDRIDALEAQNIGPEAGATDQEEKQNVIRFLLNIFEELGIRAPARMLPDGTILTSGWEKE